jgi:hypothetical protein
LIRAWRVSQHTAPWSSSSHSGGGCGENFGEILGKALISNCYVPRTPDHQIDRNKRKSEITRH